MTLRSAPTIRSASAANTSRVCRFSTGSGASGNVEPDFQKQGEGRLAQLGGHLSTTTEHSCGSQRDREPRPTKVSHNRHQLGKASPAGSPGWCCYPAVTREQRLCSWIVRDAGTKLKYPILGTRLHRVLAPMLNW